MCLGGKDGIFVQLCHNDLVASIRQVFDDYFQVFADTFYLVVGLVAEEHLDDVWR